jgi:hypothetical protein
MGASFVPSKRAATLRLRSNVVEEFSMSVRLLLAPIALAVAALSTSAHADFTVYTSQASFLAAISAPGVDSFNDLDLSGPMSTPLGRAAGGYTYTAAVGPLSNFFPAGSPADAWLASNNRTDTITFSNFSAGVQGVGGFFFRSDFAGLATSTAATLTVTATDASGTVSQALVNPGTGTFLGFVSDSAITSISFYVGAQGVGTGGVWPTVNDLTLGAAAVPEPSTYALLFGGLALVGFVARRRSTKA